MIAQQRFPSRLPVRAALLLLVATTLFAAPPATQPSTTQALTLHTATLDRKPVPGYRTSNWWPGDFSPGDGTRKVDGALADAWAARVRLMPGDALAVLDMEAIALERDPLTGPIPLAHSPRRDAVMLDAARLCRERLGPGRPISIYGIEPMPYSAQVPLEVWMRRGPLLQQETIEYFRSLTEVCRAAECMTLGGYIARAKGDADFPIGTIDRDLDVLEQRIRLTRSCIGETMPIYVWLWGRCNLPPKYAPLSETECRQVARSMRAMKVHLVVWGEPADNVLLLKALADAKATN